MRNTNHREDRRPGFDPRGRWVYIYLDAAGEPLYIGCSNDLEVRHEAHRETAPWFDRIAEVRTMGPFSRRLGFRIESALIMGLQPAANVAHTDRDPRKAANWQVNLNLPTTPQRQIRGLLQTHYVSSCGPRHVISLCGTLRKGAPASVVESAEPATCLPCIRTMSNRRNAAAQVGAA